MTMITTFAIVITGMMAGLYLGWAISVLPGLKQLNTSTFLVTFQTLNRAILNVPFKSLFVAAAIAVPLIAFVNIWTQHLPSPLFWWMASALLLFGHAGVTVFGNIPLNQALDKLHLETLTPDEKAHHRAVFQSPWENWHWVRTVATSLAFLLTILA